jgi:hypothetical protein
MLLLISFGGSTSEKMDRLSCDSLCCCESCAPEIYWPDRAHVLPRFPFQTALPKPQPVLWTRGTCPPELLPYEMRDDYKGDNRFRDDIAKDLAAKGTGVKDDKDDKGTGVKDDKDDKDKDDKDKGDDKAKGVKRKIL